MVLTNEDFFDLSLFELMQNIWEYFQHEDDEFIMNYLKWNIDLATCIWPKEFPNFIFIICKIRKQNLFFFPGAPFQEQQYIDRLLSFEEEKKETVLINYLCFWFK